MLEKPEIDYNTQNQLHRGRKPKHKPAPYRKESAEAKQRREERERRETEIEEANQKRQMKREEHEQFRKAMDRARKPGRDGQRRLGRESKLLPQMVENLLERLKDQNS